MNHSCRSWKERAAEWPNPTVCLYDTGGAHLTLNLNEEQKAAVEYLDGPSVIVAGPGSGKTRVIISKIEYLVRHAGISPSRILAMTFSTKAAEEMLDRVTASFPHKAHEFNIYNFHGFCWEIDQEFGDELGFKPNVQVLDKTASWVMTRRRIEDFGLHHFLPGNNPFKHIFDLVGHVSRSKDETISPDDYAGYAARQRAVFEADLPNMGEDDAEAARIEVERSEEVAAFYSDYRRLLKKENCLDYGDQIAMAVEILRTRPDLRRRVQDRYDFILVDEFQDTNVAQIELLSLLAGSHKKVCAVGDPDQSIYRFRGASFASFARFDSLYENCRVFPLTKNYRSTKNILAVADRLISNNDDRYMTEKALTTDNEAGEKVTVIKAPSFVAEAEAVAEEISRLLAEMPADERHLSDIAILYRAHGHRDEFEKALARRDIPYRILGGAGFYKKEEIRDIAALVKIASGRADAVALFRALQLSDWSIPDAELQKFASWAKTNDLTLDAALSKVEAMDTLTENGREGLIRARDYLVNAASAAASKPAGEVCRYLLKSTSILSRYLADDTPDSRQRAANLGKYLRKADDFEALGEDKSLAAFGEYQDLLFEAGADEEEEGVEDTRDAVQLMTVHAAKGLEWPYVFVVCLSSRRFPTGQRKEEIPFPDELMREPLPPGDFHLREERRLAYVAFTRAEKRLYLTCVERKGAKPSVFIQEALTAGDAIRLTEVPEVNFDSSVETASDVELLERDVRRAIIREVDVDSAHTLLRPLADLLSFVRRLGRTDGAENWRQSLADFNQDSSLHVEPSLTERVVDLLANRLIVDAAARDIPKETLHLSYSQINTYEECPLGYKLGCIYKIPAKPQPYFSFGTSIHLALRRFFEEVLEDRNPSLDDLLGLYNEYWEKDGYILKAQEEAYRAQGKECLAAVYARHRASEIKPLQLEWKFTLPVGPHFVHGYIDRIDPTSEGGCEVLDYKTGKSQAQKDVDTDLQLSLYALAVKECLGLVPERLSLYFLSSDEIVSSCRTDEQLEEVRSRVQSVADMILARKFDPAPDHFRCGRCDYATLCRAMEM
jgi:DNA helicase-2/ATP-dependent DNA helicase PcrA